MSLYVYVVFFVPGAFFVAKRKKLKTTPVDAVSLAIGALTLRDNAEWQCPFKGG
jgi:hypothetical protein